MSNSAACIGHHETVSVPIVGLAFAGTTGFQNPADDHAQDRIDLAKHLVTDHPSRFCWRVDGESFRESGIMHRSVAVVDYSLTPHIGNIVLVRIADTHNLKRIRMIGNRLWLTSDTPGYAPVPVDEEEGVHILGVLKHCVNDY